MTNEDKIFDLMEKMYFEMNSRFDGMRSEMNSRFDGMDARLDGLENELKKTNLKIENEIVPKIDALFDGYTQLNEKVDRIENTVNDLEKRTDKQEVEIRVIKGAK